MAGDGHVTSSIVLEFLSGLSGLSISQCVKGSDSTIFHCKVSDGSLAGIYYTYSTSLYIIDCIYKPCVIQSTPIYIKRPVATINSCI